MKTFEFEIALMVEDYLVKGAEGAAFSAAANDRDAADESARVQLLEICGPDEAANIEIEAVEFIEFDAANPRHAGAIYNVKISGPDKAIEAVEAFYDEPDVAEERHDHAVTPAEQLLIARMALVLIENDAEEGGYPNVEAAFGMTTEEIQRLKDKLTFVDVTAKVEMKETTGEG